MIIDRGGASFIMSV